MKAIVHPPKPLDGGSGCDIEHFLWRLQYLHLCQVLLEERLDFAGQYLKGQPYKLLSTEKDADCFDEIWSTRLVWVWVLIKRVWLIRVITSKEMNILKQDNNDRLRLSHEDLYPTSWRVYLCQVRVLSVSNSKGNWSLWWPDFCKMLLPVKRFTSDDQI